MKNTQDKNFILSPTKRIKSTAIFGKKYSNSPKLQPSNQGVIQPNNPNNQNTNQCQFQNLTTYDNSLATKNERVSKSMVNIELSSKSYSKDSRNPSVSKRKRFISVTQRSNDKIYNSQKKPVNSQVGFNIHESQRKLQMKQQTSKKEDMFSISGFVSPTKSFKQYISTVINSITDNKMEDNQEENILNQDIDGNDKQFSLAQKAKVERKNMRSALLLHQRQSHTEKRIYTEAKQNFTPYIEKKPIMLVTEPDSHYESRPQCFYDSRNFMVFEQKIGENTLTRKDSLILALMENLSLQYGSVVQKSAQQNSAQQFLPFTLQTPMKQKKSISLLQQQKQLPQLPSKLRDKVFSEQQNTGGKQKPQQHKIKFISLLQKQQSHRYKNFTNQNVIKDQFINLQKKASK